ncbi:MAG: hypothetical protein WDZ51_07395 [Pirellulaceae bacterium]
MTYRILFPFLAGCAGIAVAMITGTIPLLAIESVSGTKYHWWWIGFSAFISTFAATYEYAAASSAAFRKGPNYVVLFSLLAMLVPVLVVYIGLSAEFMAALMTGMGGPLNRLFEERPGPVFGRRMFYVGTLLPLIVIVIFSLIRRYKHGMALRTEIRVQ